MPDDSKRQVRNGIPWKRRQLMKSLAIGGTGILAGCTGNDGSDGGADGGADGGSDGGTETDQSSVDIISTAYSNYSNVNIGQVQFNPYNPNNQGEFLQVVIFPRLAFYPAQVTEWQPWGAANWSVTTDSATITLREQTWDNGDKLLAEDLLTKLTLEEAYDNPIFEVVDEFEKTGERTVKLTPGPANPEAFKFQLLRLRIDTPRDVYGEYADRIKNVGSDDEQNTIKEELTGFALENPPSLGPFTLSNKGSRSLIAERREEGHPHLNEVNYQQYKVVQMEAQQALASIYERKMDQFHGLIDKKTVEELPDHLKLYRFAEFTGLSVEFNHEARDVFQDETFRKAVAYVLNSDGISKNQSAMFYEGHPKITGIPGRQSNTAQNWLGDTYDSFTDYGAASSETDQAAALLENAGYSKQNGEWVKPDGKAIESFTIKAPSDWSWARAGQTIATQLGNFGLPIEYQGVNSSTILGKDFPDRNFEMMTTTWGSGVPYPLNSLGTVVYAEPTWFGENPAFLTDFEVPPLGEPQGETSTVNVDELYREMTAAGPEKAQELIREMSWLINQTIPRIPVNEKTANNIINVADFEITEEQFVGPGTYHPWMIDRGILKAKQESPTP